MQPQEQQTARLIVASLLTACRDLLGSQIQTVITQPGTFEAIRNYIDERYASPLAQIRRAGVLHLTQLSFPPFQKEWGSHRF